MGQGGDFMLCPKCGKQIEDDATFCSGCGARMDNSVPTDAIQRNKPKRKRIGCLLSIAIACLFFLVILIITCSVGQTEQIEPVAQVIQIEKSTYGLRESVQLTGMHISALNIKTSKGDDFFKPDIGKKFVGVQFQIENISKEDITVSTLLLFDIFIDDILSSYSLTANVVFGDGTLDGTIPPGKKLIGWIAVEAPQGAKIIEVQIKDDWLNANKVMFQMDIP